MKKQTREEEDAVARQMSPPETSEIDDSWNVRTNDCHAIDYYCLSVSISTAFPSPSIAPRLSPDLDRFPLHR